eukprot:GGOE01036139.1.p1 GENE.GGOE01036139.1~~GGOE01036139.1.p1  ORF type:complete len:248 (+),score=24.23 GGOE01036139.1:39-782(+)
MGSAIHVALLLLAGSLFTKATVLMEVSFDLALQQESETGYTASHTVEEYLKDPNLLWLRYLNILVSGNEGPAPMRTAFMEFKDYEGWASFESTNMERTHILYDLFWINWKRVLWEDVPSLAVKGQERTEENPGGYIFLFKYSLLPGKRDEGTQFLEQKLKSIDVSSLDGLLEQRAFTNGLWQSKFSNLLWFEFASMEALSRAVYKDSTVTGIFHEAKAAYLAEYSTSILVPSAGSQGGQFFKGGAAL